MELQEIQDRNKEIALMLGWEQYKDSKERWFEHWKPNTMLEKPWSNRVERLEFDSDYNWLMEALEFIRLLNWSYDMYCPSNTDNSDEEFECNFWDKINPEIEGRSKNSLKEAVFIAVSDFAKLHNNKEL
jgi:hypothetical protein